ncbi:tetratricopeptide repeat protein [Actinomadura coerulea]|uniref:tetratricopeptide repeat protein n=1 Tax=Actinomadura coerulea TaxID=46159 RepID=UPI003417F8C5
MLLIAQSAPDPSEPFRAWCVATSPLEQVEELWRRAFRGIDPGAARQVGQVIGWDRERIETEYRLRIDYEAGDPLAGYWLGRLLEERCGDLDRRSAPGWLEHADELYDSVLITTDRVSRAINYRASSFWYPGWRVRQVLETGRAPWGINVHALQARVYAAVRGKRLHKLYWVEPHVRSRLEWAQAAGDIEATFLLGILGLATQRDDARRWFRLAAENGHRQAAFELGMYEEAANAGHPGAAYELACKAARVDDLATAEAECRRAARGGHLRAAALLRFLQSEPITEKDQDARMDRRISELLVAWDQLSGMAPEPDRCIDFLATRSGLPRADIERMRRVRNRCAHPVEHGWPSSYELDLALTTAASLRRLVDPQ